MTRIERRTHSDATVQRVLFETCRRAENKPSNKSDEALRAIIFIAALQSSLGVILLLY